MKIISWLIVKNSLVKLAASQPTYLPWYGYFALIDYVDEFVFLENIQFNKRSWQQRNKILNNQKEIYLTMPVRSKGKFSQKILDVEIDNFKKSKKKHIDLIESSYQKSKYFLNYFEDIKNIYKKDFVKLSDLNKVLILYFCKVLDINTNLSTDTEFNLKTKKSEYLRDICLLKKSNEYITTIGSKNYIGDVRYFTNTKIKIDYYDFKDLKYTQLSNKFSSKLSIIDLIFNMGPDTINYLRKNFFICS